MEKIIIKYLNPGNYGDSPFLDVIEEQTPLNTDIIFTFFKIFYDLSFRKHDDIILLWSLIENKMAVTVLLMWMVCLKDVHDTLRSRIYTRQVEGRPWISRIKSTRVDLTTSNVNRTDHSWVWLGAEAKWLVWKLEFSR